MTHFFSHWNVSPPTSPFDSLRYVLSPRPACWGRRGLQTKLPFQLERACVGILRPVLDYVYFPSTSRLVFVRRCGFVSLLPALLRPSSCGPVALLHCPSVPAVSFLFVGVASFRSCPLYRVRRRVAPWPSSVVPPYRPFSPLVVSRPPVIFYVLWNSTVFK